MSKLPFTGTAAEEAERLIVWTKDFVQTEQLDEFKVNKVFVEEVIDYRNKVAVRRDRKLKTPLKFKVVYVSPEGVPILRELDKGGRAFGWPRIPHNLWLRAKYGSSNWQEIVKTANSWAAREHAGRFVLDNEVFDSILLGDKYKPMEEAKRKNRLLKEIREHNRKAAIAPKSQVVIKWMRQSTPGDRVWDEAGNEFTVVSVSDADDLWKVEMSFVDRYDGSVATTVWTLDSILRNRRALYSAKPRNFDEEIANGEGLI